jgi:hypothetical protein
MLTIIADALIKSQRKNKGYEPHEQWPVPSRWRSAPDQDRARYDFKSKWNKHIGLW